MNPCVLEKANAHLSSDTDLAFRGPLLLSIPYGKNELNPSFFETSWLHDLVCLDVSNLPGSLRRSLSRGSMSAASLPNLRILKARGREVDDATGIQLLDIFRGRLWSLDLSCNLLTDAFVEHLAIYGFPGHTLRSDSHSAVEGELTAGTAPGIDSYGPFLFVQESSLSGTFSHEQRYLADSPLYMESREVEPAEHRHPARSNGRTITRPDDMTSLCSALAGTLADPHVRSQDAHLLEICHTHDSITHLHLGGNNLSTIAIDKLIRFSRGRLEHLDCDSLLLPSLRPHMNWSTDDPVWSGAVGMAHLFRPLFSSNLQVLRIHHSLVTGVISMRRKGRVRLAETWISENAILKRVDLAYPQAFSPDMNPRLRSLTLTHIPRLSSGPIIDRLIAFLKLASVQDRTIQGLRTSSRRGPAVLAGLRHIRLEFEQNELGDFLDHHDAPIDSGALMEPSSDEFSFFGDGWASSPAMAQPSLPLSSARGSLPASSMPESGRLQHYPFTETEGEHCAKLCTWDGNAITVPVWIGPGIRGPHEAVNEYMSRLQNPALHTRIVPASPFHIAAGVPPGSLLFADAWDSFLVPPELPRPTSENLNSMHDVLSAIKAYRHRTKAAYDAARGATGTVDNVSDELHFHWTGKLEVSFSNSAG